MKNLILMFVFMVTFTIPVLADEVSVVEEDYILIETNEEIEITATSIDENIQPTEAPLAEVEVTSVIEEDYLVNVENLNQISMSDVYALFDSDRESSDTLYLGRPTCPHCREFSPVLKEFNELINHSLLYYNTDSEDLNDEAKTFLFETLGVPGVPTLLYIKNGLLISGWVGGGATAQELYDFFYSDFTFQVNDNDEIDSTVISDKEIFKHDKINMKSNPEQFGPVNATSQKVEPVHYKEKKLIEYSTAIREPKLPNTGDRGTILVVVGMILMIFSVALYRYSY